MQKFSAGIHYATGDLPSRTHSTRVLQVKVTWRARCIPQLTLPNRHLIDDHKK